MSYTSEVSVPAGSSVESVAGSAGSHAAGVREELFGQEQLDALFEQVEQVEQGGLRLTDEGGFLPELVRSVLERGLQAELTDHLGYEKHDRAGSGSPNSRNGTSPKTVQTEVGPVQLDVPRDRAGSFEPRLVAKGQRRGWTGWKSRSARCTRVG